MIDPNNITNYHRTTDELEEFLIFCICVAGKRADFISKAVDKLLSYPHSLNCSPLSLIWNFVFIRQKGEPTLADRLKMVGIGNYTVKAESLKIAAQRVVSGRLNLRTCTIEQLEDIYGIGPKTARYFIIHSRPDQQHAILDTHVLKFMKTLGIDTPKSSPPRGKSYSDLEEKWLEIVKTTGLDCATLDLAIWKLMKNRKSKTVN